MFPCNSCKGPKRLAALTLSLILVLCCLPLTAFGQGGQKVVRVGWFDSSFCYWDTFGRRQGIDYEYQHKIAAYTANNLRTVDVQFEAIPYPSTQAALDAMRVGEVDCVFPAYLSSYDADQQGIRLTNAVMRSDADHTLSRDSTLTFAVLEGDVNMQTFIMNRYPASTKKARQ